MKSSEEIAGQNQELLKKYLVMEKLAEGTYGIVYKAKNLKSGEKVAIKKFKNVTKQGLPTSGIREIDIMKSLNSPYLLKPMEVMVHPQGLYLVMEWKELTLAKLLSSSQPINTRQIMKQLLQAVLSMHEYHFMHRDLKPSNIILDAGQINIGLKLIDFGMSKQKKWNKDFKLTNQVGTLHYRAPQLLLGSTKYNQSIDVWAIGCIFYKILTKQIMFEENTQNAQLVTIYQQIGSQQDISELLQRKDLGINSINGKYWGSLMQKLEKCASAVQINLLKEFIQIDVSKRISCEKALLHDYFKQQ